MLRAEVHVYQVCARRDWSPSEAQRVAGGPLPPGGAHLSQTEQERRGTVEQGPTLRAKATSSPTPIRRVTRDLDVSLETRSA